MVRGVMTNAKKLLHWLLQVLPSITSKNYNNKTLQILKNFLANSKIAQIWNHRVIDFGGNKFDDVLMVFDSC
jgi:hypothetical protein